MAASSATVKYRRSRRRQALRIGGEIVRYSFLLLTLSIFVFPIYWIFTIAFKSSDEFMTSPPTWWPQHPTLDHFRALQGLEGILAFKNSLIVASCSMVLAVVIGGVAAYSIARFGTGGPNFTF